MEAMSQKNKINISKTKLVINNTVVHTAPLQLIHSPQEIEAIKTTLIHPKSNIIVDETIEKNIIKWIDYLSKYYPPTILTAQTHSGKLLFKKKRYTTLHILQSLSQV
jgi:hypothetical protein